MAELTIVHAYRHLYRGLLRAVQFSKPARFIALHQLRTAFREKGAKFDARAIIRTIRFLEAAARVRGVEHKILRNLLTVAHYRHVENTRTWRNIQDQQHSKKAKPELYEHVQSTVYKHYDMTVAMLNKSVGLCLR